MNATRKVTSSSHHPRAKTEYLPKCYAAIYVGSEQTKRITNRRSLKGPKLPHETTTKRQLYPNRRKRTRTSRYTVTEVHKHYFTNLFTTAMNKPRNTHISLYSLIPTDKCF